MTVIRPGQRRAKLWLLSLTLVMLMMLPLAATALADGTGQAAQTAIPAVATQLQVSLAASGKNTAKATATLTDATGKVRPNAPVTFIRQTTFGQLTLDTVNTDFEGQAQVTLPTYPGQKILVTAQFPGMPGLAPSQAQATMSLPEVPQPVHLGFYSQLPNPWFVLVLVIVIGGVWFTYGIAFHTVRKIRGAGLKDAAAGGTTEGD